MKDPRADVLVNEQEIREKNVPEKSSLLYNLEREVWNKREKEGRKRRERRNRNKGRKRKAKGKHHKKRDRDVFVFEKKR